MQPKAIALNGKPLGSGRFPVICVPLVGRTRQALLEEARLVAAKKPDLIEWRADFFDGISDAAAVVELAGSVKQAVNGIPILFTCRWSKEGGEKIALSQAEVADLQGAVCETGKST